jgi:hypothetical protein
MRLRIAALVAVFATAVALAVPAASTAAPPSSGSTVVVPITGTVTDLLGGAGSFVGTFTLQSVQVVNGQLTAVGTLSGTLTNALGNVIGTITNAPISIPLQASGTCDILNLTLGPLDLNLLGLMVHLDQVHLDISAQAGPGNLLGNLLCSVAHLLDSGNANVLNAIANLINQILARL